MVKDIGKYNYFTLDVPISCDLDKLYNFVKDPSKLKQWTKVFSDLKPYRGKIYQFMHDYQGLQENQKCYCEIISDDSCKIIDYYWGDNPGDYWGFASSRCISFSDHCVYVFTIFRCKEKVNKKYRNYTKIIADELNILKNIMEEKLEIFL